MSNNRSSTACSMELIICAGIFSSLVLLIRGAGPGQSNDVTVRPHFYLVDGCITQKESRHWLTEMSNGSEFTWVVRFVGGIRSLLVSKWIISLCQWPCPVENMNQSRERERQSDIAWCFHFWTSEKTLQQNHFNLIEKILLVSTNNLF